MLRYDINDLGKKLSAINAEIEFIKNSAELIPDIIEVLEKFNGKPLNIKICREIETLAPIIYAYLGKTYSGDKNRRFEIYSRYRGSGIINNQITLCYFYSTEAIQDDNNRFVAEPAIKALQNKYNELVARANETAAKLQFLEFYCRKLDQLESDLKQLTDGIPKMMKEYFCIGAEINYKQH